LVLDATNIPTDLTDFTSRRKNFYHYHELQNLYGNSSGEKLQNSCHGLEPGHPACNPSFCKLSFFFFFFGARQHIAPDAPQP
jgi:hypothetical protein